MSKTSHDWVLQIDADETLSAKLHDEIRNLIHNRCILTDAYAFPRRNYYDKDGKKWTKYAYYPDYQVRLFNKKNTKFEPNRTVLDGAMVDGKINYLPHEYYLNHYVPNKYEMSNFKNQHLRSTKLQAKWWGKNTPTWICLLKIPFIYIHHFLKMMLFNKWYKDGTVGLKASSIMALYMVMVNYYMIFDDDRLPLLFLSIFKSPIQKQIDDDYKIKIWKDL